MNIKDFLPPLFIELAKKARGLDNSKKYANYELAIKNCENDAYQNIELCNMIADKTVNHIATLGDKPFFVNPTNVFLLAAINQYLNQNETKEINILDFGGACGAHYFEVRQLIPQEISMHWYVVETAQMVKSAMERNLNNAELTFVRAIDEISVKVDFIHSSSALQYVDAPYVFTELLLRVDAKWIFLIA
ncbi:MAG: hypothetical protein IPK10_02925 [Bacteroidetes bacterium]|nr:hypothetical protein [Bacteroidota bacterium]